MNGRANVIAFWERGQMLRAFEILDFSSKIEKRKSKAIQVRDSESADIPLIAAR